MPSVGSMLDGYPVWVGRPPEPELDAREVAEAVARVGGEDAVAQVLVTRPGATTDGLVAWIRARIERDQGGAPMESDVECLELIEELAGLAAAHDHRRRPVPGVWRSPHALAVRGV